MKKVVYQTRTLENTAEKKKKVKCIPLPHFKKNQFFGVKILITIKITAHVYCALAMYCWTLHKHLILICLRFTTCF